MPENSQDHASLRMYSQCILCKLGKPDIFSLAYIVCWHQALNCFSQGCAGESSPWILVCTETQWVHFYFDSHVRERRCVKSTPVLPLPPWWDGPFSLVWSFAHVLSPKAMRAFHTVRILGSTRLLPLAMTRFQRCCLVESSRERFCSLSRVITCQY